jgi:hypothetical protein
MGRATPSWTYRHAEVKSDHCQCTAGVTCDIAKATAKLKKAHMIVKYGTKPRMDAAALHTSKMPLLGPLTKCTLHHFYQPAKLVTVKTVTVATTKADLQNITRPGSGVQHDAA